MGWPKISQEISATSCLNKRLESDAYDQVLMVVLRNIVDTVPGHGGEQCRIMATLCSTGKVYEQSMCPGVLTMLLRIIADIAAERGGEQSRPE